MRKILFAVGLSIMMAFVPVVGNIGTISAQAAEANLGYSEKNWTIDSAQNWWYHTDDGEDVKNAWVKDCGQWYLLSDTGEMRTGIFQSNGGRYYLLDTVRGTGTYGKLLTNGMVYQGVTLKCDTSADYEGALSSETVAALKAAGVNFSNVPDVSNTDHVEDGHYTSRHITETSTATDTGSVSGSSKILKIVDDVPQAVIDRMEAGETSVIYGNKIYYNTGGIVSCAGYSDMANANDSRRSSVIGGSSETLNIIGDVPQAVIDRMEAGETSIIYENRIYYNDGDDVYCNGDFFPGGIKSDNRHNFKE